MNVVPLLKKRRSMCKRMRLRLSGFKKMVDCVVSEALHLHITGKRTYFILDRTQNDQVLYIEPVTTTLWRERDAAMMFVKLLESLFFAYALAPLLWVEVVHSADGTHYRVRVVKI